MQHKVADKSSFSNNTNDGLLNFFRHTEYFSLSYLLFFITFSVVVERGNVV